jgi:hypothetical protein
MVDEIRLRLRRMPVLAFILAGLSCGIARTSLAQDEVVTYPGPAGVVASNQYSVVVEQGGAEYDSFVYLVNRQQLTNRSLTTSWTTFSFSGPVTVTITKLQGGPIGTCSILPSSFGITPRISGNTVTFELDQPRKISVEFDGDITHPMLVFADALETDIPNPNDTDVLYFGPGLHDIGDTTIPSDTKTVYLAGGAYVKGRLKVNFTGQWGEGGNPRDVKDFTFRGRGVLSGENFWHGSTYADNAVGISGTRVLVEGITIVNPALYHILIHGSNNVIRNVKMIGWWYGTDGPYVASYGLIEDCFVKTNDDAFKLFESNTTVRDCVIWQLENGAPFQISWNMPSNNSGFHIYNCDIIRMEHRNDQINLAAFDAVHGGSGHMSNYLFENIRVENANWRLFYLTLQKHEFAPPDGEMGQISDITFRNITATGNFQRPNVIKGWDANHKVYNITFENLKINGQYIHNAEEGNFNIDPETTHNIVFKVDESLCYESLLMCVFEWDGYVAEISGTDVTLEVPFGIDVTKLNPTVTVFEGDAVFPGSGAVVDFTNPVAYTVTAPDGAERVYTVTVIVLPPIEPVMLGFEWDSYVAGISGTDVTLEVPLGTDVTKLKPTVTVAPGCTVSPASGAVMDFTAPVAYTVTAPDGAEEIYTVTVTMPANGILDDLVVYWQFENDYTDSAGTNHLESVRFGTSTAPTFVPGKVGTAVSLEGSGVSNYLRTTNEVDASLLGSNARTLNVWFRTGSDAVLPLVSVGAAATNGTFQLGELFELLILDTAAWNTGNHISWAGHFWGYTEDSLFYETSSAADDPVIQVNTWYMATLVYDGNTNVQVYQDGKLFINYTLPGPLNTVLGATYDERRLLFGSSNWLGLSEQFKDSLSDVIVDDAAMWSRELSPTEIQAIYNAGVDGNGLFALVPGLQMQVAVTDGGSTLTFTWDSKDGKVYNLRSNTGLGSDPASWPIHGGNEEIVSSPLTIDLPADAKRFFFIEEIDASNGLH